MEWAINGDDVGREFVTPRPSEWRDVTRLGLCLVWHAEGNVVWNMF